MKELSGGLVHMIRMILQMEKIDRKIANDEINNATKKCCNLRQTNFIVEITEKPSQNDIYNVF